MCRSIKQPNELFIEWCFGACLRNTALTLFDFPLSVTHCEYCMHGLVSLDSVRNDIRPYVFNFIRILNKIHVVRLFGISIAWHLEDPKVTL